MDLADRKIVAQYKIGDRNLARLALVCGENEAAQGILMIRDLLTRTESALPLQATARESAHRVLQWYEQRESSTT